jgi:hypothetical protein
MIEYLTPTHQQIIEKIKDAGVVVAVNHPGACKNNKFDGFVFSWRDKGSQSGKNELAICLSTIQRNYADWQGELNRTVAHEAVHIAQMCKSKDGYIRPLGFRADKEKEALAIQENPEEVLRILRKYCL